MGSRKFESEEVEDKVLDAILDHCELHDVPIYKAIEALNPEFKRVYGAVVNKSWFSRRIRKSSYWFQQWVDVWRVKAAHRYEKVVQRADEFATKLYQDEDYETYDHKGLPVTRTRRVLQKTDIAAWSALDQAERRTIAQLMPSAFRQTAPPKDDGQTPSMPVNIYLDKPRTARAPRRDGKKRERKP